MCAVSKHINRMLDEGECVEEKGEQAVGMTAA